MEKEIYENSNKRKSVVQIILPTTSIKSEKSANQTDENNLNEWIEDKKKKINLLISRIYRRRSRRGSNISAVRKQTMREKFVEVFLENQNFIKTCEIVSKISMFKLNQKNMTTIK
ncbi:unnamed protein product [Meloidogyne enterolobii]|uniref:Uncharacterized protein n=1 Tax=Meloidogyne enterolobii TaxID=390850 RepID=A0ACB0YU52_MELEN